MTWFGKRSLTTVALAILAMGINGCGSKGTSEADKTLIENITQQNKASLERIETAIVELQWTRQELLPEASFIPPVARRTQMTSKGTGRYLYKGDWRAVTKKILIQVPAVGMSRTDTEAMVRNDRYQAVVWDTERPMVATLWEYASLTEQTSEREQDWNAMSAPNIFCYGFAVGAVSFEKVWATNGPEHFPWTVRKQEGDAGVCYEVERSLPRKLRNVYLFEPEKDFLITRVTNYDYDGSLWGGVDMEAQQLPGGVWFPRRVVHTHPHYTVNIEVVRAEVNVPVSDSEFQLDALPIDKEHGKISRFDAVGNNCWLVFRDGQWVPEDVNQHVQEHVPVGQHGSR